MTVHLEDTWAEDAEAEVRVGDVVDARGHALDTQRLIMRRWGWPKAAAKLAAEWLEDKFGGRTGFVLPVLGPARALVQADLTERIPGLFKTLMEGVANRAQREVRDAHKQVASVEVVFVRDSDAGRVPTFIADEGMVTSIASVVAGRLGVSLDDVRKRCDFQRTDGAVRMTVWVTGDED